MTQKIAVEGTLGSLKGSLQASGYEVVDLNTTQQTYVPDVLCYVISGQDQDVTGIADKQAGLPVISAHGCSDAEVVAQVKQRVDMVLSTRL